MTLLLERQDDDMCDKVNQKPATHLINATEHLEKKQQSLLH